MTAPYHQRNQEATIWCGNLDAQCSEELIFELFLQVGPVTNVNMPRDKITNLHQGYAFIEFETSEDADYAIRCMNMVKLYGKPMRVNMAAKDKKQEEFNANLFVGNLDPEIDEKGIYETFSRFGCVISCKIMTEDTSSKSRGFGFVTFDTFESADLALNAMNGQWLGGRTINVSYAFKKDGSKGERHGSEEERRLEATRKTSAFPRPKVEPMMLMQYSAQQTSTSNIPPSIPAAAAARPSPMNNMGQYGGMPNPLMAGMPGAMNPMMSMMGMGAMGGMAGHAQQQHQHQQQQQQQQHHGMQPNGYPGMGGMGGHHPGMPPMPGMGGMPGMGAMGGMPRPPMFPPPQFPPLPNGGAAGGAPSYPQFPPAFPPAPPGGAGGYTPQYPMGAGRAYPQFGGPPPVPSQ